VKKIFSMDFRAVFLTTALVFSLLAGGWLVFRESPKAFGGHFAPFAPQMAQQGGRYQIAGCDANSAWVIDTTLGDVFLIYTTGKWKEVGSIMDEKKRIRK